MVQATSNVPATGPMAGSPQVLPYHQPMVILRIVQAVLSVIILGLTAYAVSAFAKGCGVSEYYDPVTGDYYTTYYSCSFGSINYMVFASVWTLLISIYYLVSIFARNIYNVIGSIVLDALSTIIWFASFVSLAVLLGVGTDGRGDRGNMVVQVLEAADVFGAFMWLSFVAALVLTILRHRAVRRAQYGSTPMQQYPGAQAQVPQQNYPTQPTVAQHV